jgi:hypothetical protein
MNSYDSPIVKTKKNRKRKYRLNSTRRSNSRSRSRSNSRSRSRSNSRSRSRSNSRSRTPIKQRTTFTFFEGETKDGFDSEYAYQDHLIENNLAKVGDIFEYRGNNQESNYDRILKRTISGLEWKHKPSMWDDI